ncbi:MAG: aminotransferase class III-fold pyridoxal phosphate-dependent enzyme [Gemmatimonadales bacterium]|nr:aminotransferase class III-fold pyridoxal phosphate-dependent enzyme [Gemmatimonadales bacterium]
MPNGIRSNPEYPGIAESERLWGRSIGLIPSGTQTLAKGPGQFVSGVAPKYLRRGKGARVWDVDGNEFLDLCMAIGPVVLGYGDPAVDAAIREQLEDGITFSLMHPLEVEVAELVRRVVPGVEAVRFSKTGADVTSAAIRVARAWTGRSRVLCCGYHGWHDWYIGITDRHHGVPDEVRDLTNTFGYNDPESVATALDDDVAAVILEPVTFEEPRHDFLAHLRERCDANGTLLIFDEMWTGFRLALGGAQAHYGVRADLVTFSKAIANGMPLSVLAGRGDVLELLDGEVFFYTTFGGEALSLAAAKATIGELERRDVPAQLSALGGRLREGYNRLAAAHGLTAITRCAGPACRTQVVFETAGGTPLELKSLVQQELLKRGVLWAGTHTLSAAHTEDDVAYLLSAYDEVLPILSAAVERGDVRSLLRGAPVEPVFRRTTDFNQRPRPAHV